MMLLLLLSLNDVVIEVVTFQAVIVTFLSIF